MGVYLSEPITRKDTKMGSGAGITYCCSQMQGWRKHMEDSALHQVKLADGNAVFGVFDGHGGPEVSTLVKQVFLKELIFSEEYKSGKFVEALKTTFKRVDEYITSKVGERRLSQIRFQKGRTNQGQGQQISENAGCTANVLLVTRNKYYIANAGDSRCALLRGRETIELSKDHKPQLESERKRIQQAGGSIVMGRVNGGLNLTRAFGDFKYKKNRNLSYDKQMITCDPDIKEINRTSQDEMIIMGCDGIWERYADNSSGLLRVVKQMTNKFNKSYQIVTEKLLDNLLAPQTTTGVGCDNMTVILIAFT